MRESPRRNSGGQHGGHGHPKHQSEAPTPSATVGATPSATPTGVNESAFTRVTCDLSPRFPVELLEGSGNAEAGDEAFAVALRELFETPSGSELPTTDWRVVAEEPAAVYLLAPWPSEYAFAFATIRLVGNEWKAITWGGCRPQADVGELSLAEFFLAPGQSLEADQSDFDVIVVELACTGFHTAEGRVTEPAITVSEDAITVVFAVVPLEGDDLECPGHPGTPYVLQLPEPLGDRVLLDGSTVPAHEPTECTNPRYLVC